MKKTYIYPTIDIHEMGTKNILMSSLIEKGMGDEVDIVITDDPIIEDADEAVSREDDFDWSTLIMIFVFTLFGLNVSAQNAEPAPPIDGKKHAMTITFKDNTVKEYVTKNVAGKEKIDKVTYLPGVGMKVYVEGSETSVDYLFSEMQSIEYEYSNNENSNWEKVGENMWNDYPEAWRLEYPQLSYDRLAKTKDDAGASEKCQIIVKRCDPYGITFSLEWDNKLVANRWTCYELHAGNTMSTVKRKDDFKADPEVAVSSQLSDYKNSGFARGHLCPSADRLCSVDQNKQTFFLTNMQPQYTSHNSGLWSRLEDLVRDFATDDSYTGAHCDTLYVVKAATITDKVTIDDAQVDGIYADKCNGNLIVPKYFYMALLHYNKDTDSYQALALWTDHIGTTQPVANLGDYAISIEELEKRTGIDFFCNLPDDIETEVEKTLDLNFWHLTKSTQ
jgi:endonuclease G